MGSNHDVDDRCHWHYYTEKIYLVLIHFGLLDDPTYDRIALSLLRKTKFAVTAYCCVYKIVVLEMNGPIIAKILGPFFLSPLS